MFSDLDDEWSDATAVSVLCLSLSVCAGLAKTIAAVVIAFPEQRAKHRNYERSFGSKIGFLSVHILFAVSETCFKILAVGQGPVAVATPVMVGTNLLSNMLLQPLLGIASYTQDVIIGTSILAAAVAMLKDVGPCDIPPDVQVLDLMLQPVAIAFLSASVCLMLVCLFLICSGRVNHNMSLVFLYAILSEVSTVICNASAKVLQMEIPLVVFALTLVLYCFLGFVTFATGARANGTLDDPKLFIPVGAAVNLIMTCLAGLFVWGDGTRLKIPFVYCMIYVQVVLSSYLVSKDDLLGATNINVQEAHAHKLKTVGHKVKTAIRRRASLTFADPALIEETLPQKPEADGSYANKLGPHAPRGRRARSSLTFSRSMTMPNPITAELSNSELPLA